MDARVAWLRVFQNQSGAMESFISAKTEKNRLRVQYQDMALFCIFQCKTEQKVVLFL